MSVINQMLKDLERRGAAPELPLPPPLPPAGERRVPRGLLAGVAGLALFSGAAGSWFVLSGGALRPLPQVDAPAASSVAAVPVDGPVPAVIAPAPVAPDLREVGPVPELAVVALDPPAVHEPPHSVQAQPNPPVSTAVPPPSSAPAAGKADPAAPAAPPVVARRARPPSPQERAETALAEARAALAAGREDQAAAALRLALEALPAHRAARELLAAVLMNAGRGTEAEEVLYDGLDIASGYSPYVQLLARLHLERQDLDGAVAVLERQPPALVAEPAHHAFLAALQQRQGRHREAALRYRALLELRPVEAAWWVGLGISLEGLGQPGEARQAYQRATESGTLTPELGRYTAARLAALSPP